MKILLCGMDGYLGWSLTQKLISLGHDVIGIDNLSRRDWVKEGGSDSVTPVLPISDRLEALKSKYNYKPIFYNMNVCDYPKLSEIVRKFCPDTIVQLAEQSSAPYSIIDFNHHWNTIENNLKGTLSIVQSIKEEVPKCHLYKIGSMGEYFGINTDIPEGKFGAEDMFRGKSLDGLLFPRRACSPYHASKIYGTYLLEMASRFWNIRSTDVMQGVVFSPLLYDDQEEELLTRLDTCDAFGTIVNRFVCQAIIGIPLTLYGKGHQKRGYLPHRDAIDCITLAIENPPEIGEHRIFNQLEEVYDATELANKVKLVGNEFGLDVKIGHYENPRIENEDNYLNPDHQKLLDLGYRPNTTVEDELRKMFKLLLNYKSRIELIKKAIIPSIRWDGSKSKSKMVDVI